LAPSRSFELTEEGQVFYERCTRIVADIADAESEASSKGATIKGLLRIGAPMELGRRLVSPLITEFRQQYPDVQAHLVLSDAGLDVVDDGLDVALRNGLPSDSGVIARKVLTAKRIVCASPLYFKKHGIPARPGDLLKHDCIRLVRGRRVVDTWVFQEQGKRFEVVVNGTLSTTSGEVVHDWVREGKGIALKADWDLQPDLRAGSIVRCLDDYWCDEINLFALCANRRHLSPRIRAFLKFIVTRLPEAVSASAPGQK
jgi:DNA-binding transcriptional LysR family regulator